MKDKPRNSQREEKWALAWLDKNQMPLFAEPDPRINYELIPEEEKSEPETIPLFSDSEAV